MEVKEAELAYQKRKYTIEEYLELENASEIKHEYYQGEIFAMAGNKSQHIIVTGNLFGNLWNKLKGKPCRPFNSETRIYIEKLNLFTYPDLSVFCGALQTLNNDDFNFLNPAVIFEVLSTSSREYDKTGKFSFYRNIPSLKEYVLIEPGSVHIEAFRVNNQGSWELKEYNNIEDSFALPSIARSLPLRNIYANTAVLEKIDNNKNKQS